MKLHYRSTIILPFFVILLMVSCIFTPKLEPLDDYILFASIDGNPKGLWMFDANTLEKIDSLEMDWVPFSFDISDDKSTWYSMLNGKDIITIDANTKTINLQTTTRNLSMILDRQKKHIITYYGSDFIQFYDAETFELVNEDSIGLGVEGIRKMVTSSKEDKLYAFHNSDQGLRIMVYNTKTYQIDQLIDLSDNLERNMSMSPADLIISPIGDYLFATIYNWSGPNTSGGYGSFHVIDLSLNQVIAEFECGSYSQMGICPDGSCLYISDPAGNFFEATPSNKILKFDISSQKLRVFVNGSSDFGLNSENNSLITNQITVAPDNRSMFITFGGSIKSDSGENVHMAKIDIYTKKVLDYYSISRDSRGYITSEIKKIQLYSNL